MYFDSFTIKQKKYLFCLLMLCLRRGNIGSWAFRSHPGVSHTTIFRVTKILAPPMQNFVLHFERICTGNTP